MNLLFLSQALQGCALLGAIVGSDLMEERKRSATGTAKRPVDGTLTHTHTHTHTHTRSHTHALPTSSLPSLPGFVLEGFDLEHSGELLGSMLRATTELLPAEKPRFIHGMCTPGGAAMSCD